MDLALLALLQLVALALLTAAAAGAGWAVAPRLTESDPVERWAVRAALGLGALGTALFLLGLVGGLRRGVVAGLAAVALGLAVTAWVRARRPQPAAVAGARRGRWLPAVALAVVLLPTFVWGLFPPIGHDAVTYHLPFARAFVESHRLVAVPELLFAVFPQLAEVLFAALLLTPGADSATHLVQLLATALTATLLYAGGRRFFSPVAGLCAAALWLAHPLVHYQAASAYVDVVLALFCLLALYGWERWREGAGRGWLAVAGAAAGFAAGTKYLGLLWGVLLVLATLVAGRPRQRLRGAVLLALVALAVGGPWYARIYLHTGNPVHPFLGPVFGGEARTRFDRDLGLEEGSGARGVSATLAKQGVEALQRPLELPRFAWRAAFVPRAFGRQSPLAPWHLALVPLALVFALRDSRLLRWLSLVLAYALLPGTLSDPRFQLPSLAVLALAGAGALHHLGTSLPALGRMLRRPLAAWSLALVLVAPGPLYAAFKVGKLGGLPPASAAAREAFLARQLVGLEAIRLLDDRHGSRYVAYVVGAPYLTYHARGRLLGQWGGRYRIRRVLPLLRDPDALHRELAEMEATHLLLVQPPAAPAVVAGDPRFRRLAGGARYHLYALAPDE
ncbi:MAG TPA: glycosyltransferase family 39 protein [Thermoanaerobaculia bacterium]|nr:glycosyltransferase family 39 protein [Thermoanaerobaculia bacterium]